MFWRRKKPELTADAYRRWLRAFRPPMDLFVSASEVEQEGLATLGDAYAEDCILAVARALGVDPDATPVSGEDQAREIADAIMGGMTKAVQGRRTEPAGPPQTMSGFKKEKSFLGKPADAAEENGES